MYFRVSGKQQTNTSCSSVMQNSACLHGLQGYYCERQASQLEKTPVSSPCGINFMPLKNKRKYSDFF